MIWLQIFISLLVILIWIKIFKQWHKNKMSLLTFLIWFVLWAAILLVFWQPDLTTYLANFLGIGRGADLIVYLSIVLIFYLIFKIFIRLDKTDKLITKMVREDAIKNADKR
jgi:hypothetical protein